MEYQYSTLLSFLMEQAEEIKCICKGKVFTANHLVAAMVQFCSVEANQNLPEGISIDKEEREAIERLLEERLKNFDMPDCVV